MMKLNIYNNEIYEIENFLTIEEQKFYLDIIKNSSEDDWPDLFVLKERNQTANKVWAKKLMRLPDFRDPIHVNVQNRIESLFESFGKINPIILIQRYRQWEGKGQHNDDIATTDLKYGLVLYINEDYEGGEIIYPDYNLRIKPKACSLVLHPGYLDHFVSVVESEAPRYVMTTFAFIKDDQEVVIKKNLGLDVPIENFTIKI